MKCSKCKKCDIDCFDSLLLKYEKLDSLENADFENALYEVKDAIKELKEAIGYIWEKNVVGVKIDEWLEDCIDRYETKWPECKCNNLRNEFHALKSEIEELENDCLEIAELLKEKIKQVIELDNIKEELLEEIEEKCYPQSKNCK